MQHFRNILTLIGNFAGELPTTFLTNLLSLLGSLVKELQDSRDTNAFLRRELDALRLDYANMIADRNHYRDQANEYAQRLATYRAKSRDEDAVKAFNWLVANEQLAWDEVKKSTATNKFIQLIKVVRQHNDTGLAASKDAVEKFLREVRPNPGNPTSSHTWFQTNPADLKALREKLTGEQES